MTKWILQFTLSKLTKLQTDYSLFVSWENFNVNEKKKKKKKDLRFTVLDLCFYVRGVWIQRFWSDLAGEHCIIVVGVDFDESRRRLRSTFTVAASTRHVPKVSSHIRGLVVTIHCDDFTTSFHHLPSKPFKKIEYFKFIATAIEYIDDLNHGHWPAGLVAGVIYQLRES